MLKSFNSYHGIFIEITKSEHQHGGDGWEFGKCLWSPSKDRGGKDRYSLMREPKTDDLILHCYHDTWNDGKTDTRLCAYSFVERPFIEVVNEPPIPGKWANQSPYYRIDLKNFSNFTVSIPISTLIEDYSVEILANILEDKPKFFLFNTHGSTLRTVQGIYLAACTEKLFDLLIKTLNIQAGIVDDNNKPEEIHNEYSESKRLVRERYFFARNPKLVKEAKKKHGFKCQACGFDFLGLYGKLGEGFIEAHHKKPLSEHPDIEWTEEIITKVDDINVLCSNCHRMIHRRKPALRIEELIDIINSSKK